MVTLIEESKRIRRFQNGIVTAIPKFPNNKETKLKLKEMSLSGVLLHYLSWMSRYISIKPRKVIIRPAVTTDPRWGELKSRIEFLLEKVRKGKDLTPHLSDKPSSRGYTPTASEKGPGVDKWADKDFLLNAMGFHHFHLGVRLEKSGYVERTNEVLFAEVTRETFGVMGIFDHSVFDWIGEELSPERKRLWEIFNSHVAQGVPPGTVVVSSPIATSGHPIHLVETASLYSRSVRQMDPKLDDRGFIQELYESARSKVPKNPKLEWALNFSDLGIHEKSLNYFFILHPGFN